MLFADFAFGQSKTPEEFGFRYVVFKYRADSINILIKSKKGEENIPKPLFFFCQRSLSLPLIIYLEEGVYSTFPFNTDSLSIKYHLVIVSKPGIPLIADAKSLKSDFTYIDGTGIFPKEYTNRNLLSY